MLRDERTLAAVTAPPQRRARAGEEAGRRIDDRARQFLSGQDTTEEVAWQFLMALVEVSRERGKEARRMLWLALAIAALFMLLAGRGVGEFSFLGVKVTSLALLQIYLPPAAAAVMVRAICVNIERRIAGEAYYAISRHKYPSLYSSDYDELLLSSASPLIVSYAHLLSGTRLNRTLNLAENVDGFVLTLAAPAAFFGWAYLFLFQQHGAGHLLVWVSLAVSVALIALALVVYLQEMRESSSR